MSRLRIAYCIDTIEHPNAGTERQVLETLARLDREAFDPRLIVLRGSPWLAGARLPCPLHDLKYSGFFSLGFPSVVRRLRELLDREAIEIVHCFHEESIVVARLATMAGDRQPILVGSQRDIGLGAAHPWYHGLVRRARAWAHRSAALIVTNAEGVKRHVIETEGVPEERIVVVRNGVEIDDRPRPRPAAMATHGEGPWVGVVANLRSVKRLDLFVGALARVAAMSASGGVRGVVIGEGPERARLESQARQLGVEDRLFLVGASDDPRAYLQHLDLFVLCSDREGLSNAVIEAMSCGLPIVATDVGGNPELVDASNGVLVRPGDVDDLTAAIVRLLQDPDARRSMGRASRSRVERDFSWSETLRQLEVVYRGLIAAAPSRQPAEVRS